MSNTHRLDHLKVLTVAQLISEGVPASVAAPLIHVHPDTLRGYLRDGNRFLRDDDRFDWRVTVDDTGDIGFTITATNGEPVAEFDALRAELAFRAGVAEATLLSGLFRDLRTASEGDWRGIRAMLETYSPTRFAQSTETATRRFWDDIDDTLDAPETAPIANKISDDDDLTRLI